MKTYVLQNLKSDLGETANARLIAPRNSDFRVVETSGAEVTIQPEVNVVYKCGELSALTISSFPADGSFTVVFTSGASAATLTVPQTLAMPDRFQVEANTRYEINVLDGYALAAGWAVSA